MHRFQIISPVLRTAAPGDILVPTLALRPSLRPPSVVADLNIQLPKLTVAPSLGHLTVDDATYADIILPALHVSPTVPAPVVEAPGADSYIRLPALHVSPTIVAPIVQNPGGDSYIRLPALTISPTIAAPIVNTDDTSAPDDDSDDMIGGGMLGGRTI